MARTRISVTIPPALVEAADRVAETRSRSRSWVISEAVATYTADAHCESGPPPEEDHAEKGLDPSRLAQLEADMALTPERRVLEAELTGRLAAVRSRRAPRHFVIAFEDYRDYLAWKDREAAGGA